MSQLIGLLHYECNLPNLIKYIDTTFGTPKSLMLELPPDWRRYENQKHHLNYFMELAGEYEKRGTHIIAGDRNSYAVAARISDKFLGLEERLQTEPNLPLPEKLKIIATLSALVVAYNLRTQFNLRVPSKVRKRNEGFVEAYDEEKPEVIVVGDEHAKFLKSQRPEVPYTYFTLKGEVFWVLDKIENPLGRSIRPDSIHKA